MTTPIAFSQAVEQVHLQDLRGVALNALLTPRRSCVACDKHLALYKRPDGEKVCYLHAPDTARTFLARWRVYALAELASWCTRLCPEDSERRYGATHAVEREWRIRPNDPRRPALFTYAIERGYDHAVHSYSSTAIERAEYCGFLAYAVASGDPTPRHKVMLLDLFRHYDRVRWPKNGDPCPEYGCKGVMEQADQYGGVCPLCAAEKARKAALTPEEREAESRAAGARIRKELAAKGLLRGGKVNGCRG